VNIKFKQATRDYVESLKVGDLIYIVTDFYGDTHSVKTEKIKTITPKKKDIKTEQNTILNKSGHSYYVNYSMRSSYIIEPTEENIKKIELFKLYLSVKRNFDKSIIDKLDRDGLMILDNLIKSVKEKEK
jgi:hypothetical protein